MDWEEYFPDTTELVQAAQQRLLADKERINYVNARFKLFDEPESPWLYDITLSAAKDGLIISEKNGQTIKVDSSRLYYVKLRPFYYAACIGFKAFVLYPHPNNDDETSL